MKVVSLDQLPEQPNSHNPEIKKKVMLRKGEVEHLTNFSQTILTSGQRALAHSHEDMYEVFLVESGDGVAVVNGQEVPLTAGSCIMIEPGETHEFRNTSSTDLTLTYFGIEVGSL